ncbi:chaperone NapD [Azospirillum halopraeferens]|uniref:chaperone NapD n=1 Tax=Azospirillum halopraeferens TaxID=34010 RepID=UPI0003FFBFD6|nr:chaperone NapD [Azospirillum halopraeferens]
MRVNRFVREEAARPPRGHNICGVLVHADPARLDAACGRLTALPGVEIHQSAADGRLVLTIEDAEGAPAALTLKTLTEIEGVASAALVYHHCETDDLSEEMPS